MLMYKKKKKKKEIIENYTLIPSDIIKLSLFTYTILI